MDYRQSIRALEFTNFQTNIANAGKAEIDLEKSLKGFNIRNQWQRIGELF